MRTMKSRGGLPCPPVEKQESKILVSDILYCADLHQLNTSDVLFLHPLLKPL